jgi:predicted NUDIX family NTP pyrophosphohydrolase
MAMKKHTAGLLLYRRCSGRWEVFLAHPGGPFWAKKDAYAWSIPKGMCDAGEQPLAAARREFEEETGFRVEGPFRPLSALKQSSGKILHAWAVEHDCDPAAVRSNEFSMEWPPRSGQMRSFPEIDRAAWFPLAEAATKIHKGQAPLLDELRRLLETPLSEGDGV